jgi:manganese/zinc/iron transport system substrate-binding protein
MISRRHVLFASGTVLAALATSRPAWAQAPAKRLDVVATTGMIGDAVRQVAGERATVTTLMGSGVDPHSYRQTRSDIARLARADLVAWHGLYLEAQMESLLLDLGKRRPVKALGEGVPRDLRLADSDYPDRFDPHVWMDPRLWTHVVSAARDALTQVDPDGAAVFAANAERHLGELRQLAEYADRAFATVPSAARVLVTAHDAFNYFGRAYGFEVEGIQGISTDSEAGLRRVQELVELLVSRKIGAVFVETSVADRNVKALIEGAAARGHKVAIGGELFSDAMGQPGTYEGTYVGMIDHNTTVIARALGGNVPDRGLAGKLAHAG